MRRWGRSPATSSCGPTTPSRARWRSRWSATCAENRMSDHNPSLHSPAAPRPHGRSADALRPLHLTLGGLKFAEGSARIEIGDTHVLAAASIENRVPPFLVGSGRGWVTAEY